MTFKIDPKQLNADPNPGTAPGRTNSRPGSNPSETTSHRPFGHDHTPTRQRELEILGNNQRSRVEGHSNGHGNKNGHHRSGHSGSGPKFDVSGSEGGIGLSLSGELGDLDLEAGVRLNNLRDGGRSHNLRSGKDVLLSSDARLGNDVRPGSDTRPGTDFRSGNDVRPGTDFRSGSDTRPDNNFRSGNDLRSGSDFRPGPDFRPGNDFRPDFRHPQHDGFHPSHSKHGPKGAEHLFQETLRTLRNELNALRVDSFRGSEQRPLGLSERNIERILQIATRGVEDGLGRNDIPQRIARQLRADVSGVIRLEEHFSRLERVGGDPVRRAYEAVLNFALTRGESESNRLPWLPELLRDLSVGAFLHPRDMEGPFPLTGRARIVSEMMALMRTLEAIEKFFAQARVDPFGKFNGDLPFFSFGRIPGVIGADVLESIAKAIANSGPTLPGMAGRMEMLRLVAALNGVVTDSAGRPLIMAEGAPLKLGDLLWFNGPSGAIVDLLSGDRLSTRLYPTLLQGFDAVFSLIGFDGRSLSLPRFIAIQSQMNASEFEWFFGREPVRERWLRAVIEFLKDSISFDHNVLGEMLEEAITNDRFHFAVMRGTVEEGRAVAGSFSFEPAMVK